MLTAVLDFPVIICVNRCVRAVAACAFDNFGIVFFMVEGLSPDSYSVLRNSHLAFVHYFLSFTLFEKLRSN
jgi:hypothetical protein